MKIDFSCPSCGRLLKAPVQATGHLLSCPACKEKILVPKDSNKNKEQNDTPAVACKSSISDHDNQQHTVKINFPCPSCDRLLNAPVQATGRLLSCPACKKQIRAPEYSDKKMKEICLMQLIQIQYQEECLTRKKWWNH
ncbi:MAG: hypothetical protein ACTFAL_13795 [Candidatus Electronema sp. V4]|uniref:hypothetical protein n=1 Tax=Candidatus Electronema sp. V4 TaxID=3454756 RepID=UPI004055988A